MNTIFTFLRRPFLWALIGMAFFVGLAYSLPPILIARSLHNSGQPFLLAQFGTYKDEMTVYLPRAREIYDGHWPPQDLYFNEERPSALNPLPPTLFAPFLFLFQGNVNRAYVAAQFVFAAVIFLLFYAAGWGLSRSRLWSILIGLLATLTPLATLFYQWVASYEKNWSGIVSLSAVIVKQFVPVVNTEIHKLFLARIDDPLLTYPIYISAIALLFWFWRQPSFKKGIALGIFSGLLFYTYFHYWVYWMMVLGFLTIFLFVKRKQRLEYWKPWWAMLAVLALVAMPFAINYFQVATAPGGNDYTYRFGIAEGRSLSVIWQFRHQYPIYALAGLLAFLIYRKKDQWRLALLLALTAAMFAGGNLQLVTGFMPAPGQISKAIAPMLFLLAMLFLYEGWSAAAERWPKLKTAMLVTVFCLIALVGLKKIVNVMVLRTPSAETAAAYTFPEDIIVSWRWINGHVEGEPAVVSPSLMTSLYLSTYTASRPFLATGFASVMPMKDLEERFLIANKLFGVGSDTLRKRLVGDQLSCAPPCVKDSEINLNKTPRFLYVNYFGKRNPILEGQPITEAYLDKLLERYAALDVRWQAVGADYVYYGPLEKEFGIAAPRDKALEAIYQNKTVTIYKITR